MYIDYMCEYLLPETVKHMAENNEDGWSICFVFKNPIFRALPVEMQF